MLEMRAQLDLYKEIRALSSQMMGAAQANDWARLIRLESRVATLRDELTANADVGLDAAVSTPEIERKRRLIQQILEDDAEIRRYTEPWMEHVRQYLGSQSRRRQVQQAYAATDGAAGSGGLST